MRKRLEILRIAELPVSLMFGLFMGWLAVDAAYTQRGYVAVGSEILVFPMAAFAMFFFFQKLICALSTWNAEAEDKG